MEENPEKKPSKKIPYLRMKKRNDTLPGRKPSKAGPVRYKDLLPFEGKPKPNLSEWQLKTFNSRIKVKPGESREEWLKRTRSIRVLEESEVNMLAVTHKFQIKRRKDERKGREYQNAMIRNQSVVREFDFLKYYAIVMNFHAIKYGIRKDDLEVGFFFYENDPFTRTRFENASVLISGSTDKRFRRFIDNNYMYEIIKTDIRENLPEKESHTGLYKLNSIFIKRLTHIYRILGRKKEMRLVQQKELTPLSLDERAIFAEMNQEIIEIKSGRKSQEKIE